MSREESIAKNEGMPLREIGGRNVPDGLDVARSVKPHVLVELTCQRREVIVALQFGIGPVDHANRTLQPRLVK